MRLRGPASGPGLVLAELRWDSRRGARSSITRDPDIDGATTDHDAANNPADPPSGDAASPGRRVDGSTF